MQPLSLRAVLFTLALLVGGAGVPIGLTQAAGGPVPIGGACVAEGCVPGDPPGFPITIQQPGSYVLITDLIVPAGKNGIVIQAHGVSLDLNGFAIQGPVLCYGEPVTSCTGTTGIGLSISGRGRAFGGRIQGFGSHGVLALEDVRLFDLVISGNGGNGVEASRGVSIERVTTIYNLQNGVRATAGGAVEISRSSARYNGLRGIDVSGALVLQNRLHYNGLEGLRSLLSTADTGYALNTISGNNAGGPQVNGGDAIGCNVLAGTTVCP